MTRSFKLSPCRQIWKQNTREYAGIIWRAVDKLPLQPKISHESTAQNLCFSLGVLLKLGALDGKTFDTIALMTTAHALHFPRRVGYHAPIHEPSQREERHEPI